jgi:hypothetical protein
MVSLALHEIAPAGPAASMPHTEANLCIELRDVRKCVIEIRRVFRINQLKQIAESRRGSVVLASQRLEEPEVRKKEIIQ